MRLRGADKPRAERGGNDKRNDLFHFYSPGAAHCGRRLRMPCMLQNQCIEKDRIALFAFVANCNSRQGAALAACVARNRRAAR
jgi:hypothetical protein